jgi:hypothetical protein
MKTGVQLIGIAALIFTSYKLSYNQQSPRGCGGYVSSELFEYRLSLFEKPASQVHSMARAIGFYDDPDLGFPV